jgi:TetR/AcrR family transcriptional regulator, transcriptional repressor for nem operon
MKEKILDAGQTMVQDRGLNAVSFQDLADAVGLSKASVFHHFKNKDALAMGLLKRCQTTYGAQYAEVLAKDLPAPKKLREIAQLFEAGLKSNELCLLGALGNGSGMLSKELQAELQSTADATIDRYKKVFEQGRREGTLTFEGSPKQAATAFLAMLQGLQVLARAQRDLAAFAKAASSYIQSIAT